MLLLDQTQLAIQGGASNAETPRGSGYIAIAHRHCGPDGNQFGFPQGGASSRVGDVAFPVPGTGIQQIGRKMLQPQWFSLVAKYQCNPQCMLEWPKISRRGMSQQEGRNLVRDADPGHPLAFAVDHAPDQVAEVFALAKRRKYNTNPLDSVIQILSEAA